MNFFEVNESYACHHHTSSASSVLYNIPQCLSIKSPISLYHTCNCNVNNDVLHYVALHVFFFFIYSRDYDDPAITNAYEYTIRGFPIKDCFIKWISDEFIIEE